VKCFAVVQWKTTTFFDANATESLRQKHKFLNFRTLICLTQLTAPFDHPIAKWLPGEQPNSARLGKLHQGVHSSVSRQPSDTIAPPSGDVDQRPCRVT
jgi:hypothetical protein